MKKVIFLLLALVLLRCEFAEAVMTSELITYVDWTQLSITTSGTVNWGFQATIAYADASYNGITTPQAGPNQVNSWGDINAVNDPIPDTKGHSFSTADTFGTAAFSRADGTSTWEDSASSLLHRVGWFDFSGNTSITFSVPFVIDKNFSSTSPGESWSGYAQLRMFLMDSLEYPFPILVEDLQQYNFNTLGQATPAVSGTLSITYDNLPQGYYGVETQSYTRVQAASPRQQTVVPEPATCLLLGIGAVCAGLFKKKKLI